MVVETVVDGTGATVVVELLGKGTAALSKVGGGGKFFEETLEDSNGVVVIEVGVGKDVK